MSIKIIGAGLPRTGTNTLKESLEKLGYKKTYHNERTLVQSLYPLSRQTLKETRTTNWDGRIL